MRVSSMLIHAMTLGKGGQSVSYSIELLERIFAATQERQCGRVFTAIDKAGVIHAAIFVIWDEQQAYYLISSIDPDYRNSGATTYLLKEAIRYVRPLTKSFDFEGSMTESVEASFRQFGTTQKPYLTVSHTPSLLVALGLLMRDRGYDPRRALVVAKNLRAKVSHL